MGSTFSQNGAFECTVYFLQIDILLICGDFQAVRNRSDFHGLAVPPKFQKLNTFYKYLIIMSILSLICECISLNFMRSTRQCKD